MQRRCDPHSTFRVLCAKKEDAVPATSVSHDSSANVALAAPTPLTLQEPVRIPSVSDAGDLAGTLVVKAGQAQEAVEMPLHGSSPNGTQRSRGRPESEFECPICKDFLCYPVTMVPCGAILSCRLRANMLVRLTPQLHLHWLFTM